MKFLLNRSTKIGLLNQFKHIYTSLSNNIITWYFTLLIYSLLIMLTNLEKQKIENLLDYITLQFSLSVSLIVSCKSTLLSYVLFFFVGTISILILVNQQTYLSN